MADKSDMALSMSTTAVDNTPITLFSADGTPRSSDAFASALVDYEAGKRTPDFIVRPSGSMSAQIRSNLLNRGEQAKVAGAGVGLLAGASPLLLALQHFGVIPQGTAESVSGVGSDIGKGIGAELGQQINTPGGAAATLAMGAAGALHNPGLVRGIPSPESGLPQQPTTMFNPRAILGNALKDTAAYMGGKYVGDVATGMPFTPANPGDVAQKGLRDAAFMFGLNSITGFANGFLQRFFGSDATAQVAKQQLDAIKAKYPTNVAGDMNAIGSTPKGISDIAGNLGEALMGSVDNVAGKLIADVKANVPGTLSVGDQHTINAIGRRLGEASRDMVNSMGKVAGEEGYDALAKQYAEAALRFNSAREELQLTLGNLFNNRPKVSDAVVARIGDIGNKFIENLDNFQDGMRVLQVFKDTGQANGYNPVAMVKGFQQLRSVSPGSLTQQQLDILGQGETPAVLRAVGSKGNEKLDVLKGLARFLKLPANFLMETAHLNPPYQPPALAWQRPGNVPTPMVLGAQAVGRDALRQMQQSMDNK